MESKDVKFDFRIKEKDKEFLREVAEKEGVSLSAFIYESAMNRAKRLTSKK